nr:MAG TPA: RecT protein [Caudoviricetes sp.]
MNLPVPHDVLHAVATIAGTNDVDAFSNVLASTIMPSPNVRPEQITAFLMVAKEYKLNPITKEIYAFPAKGGGVQPIVSIDGWLKIINSHPDFDGMEFRDTLDEGGNLRAVTCRIYRKNRAHPVEMTEYMDECRRNTDPWRQWPNRMLRHKATIQAARYAFGFSGIADPDEAERSADAPRTAVAEVLASDEQIAELRNLLTRTGKDENKMLAYVGVERMEDMTAKKAENLIAMLRKHAPAEQPTQDEVPETETYEPGEDIPL